MSTFLYFIAGDGNTPPRREDLPGLGIGHAFEQGGGMAVCGVSHGIDGLRGHVLADPGRMDSQRVGYYPDAQQWRRMPGRPADAPAVFVGIYRDSPPTPANLRRREMLTGHDVKLADGHDWHVPVARGLSDTGGTMRQYIALPCTFGIDDAGDWTANTVEARFAPLWEAARQWVDATALMSGKPDDSDAPGDSDTTPEPPPEADGMSMTDAANFATLALSTNYRVARAEVAMLGLLNQMNVGRVLNALIDLPTFARWAAKNAIAAGSSIDAGPAAATPDTAQASPTLSN